MGRSAHTSVVVRHTVPVNPLLPSARELDADELERPWTTLAVTVMGI